jgi:hypothetical protein
MAREFVECSHPKLPKGQTARLPRRRDGGFMGDWRPVTTKKKKPARPAKAGQESPATGDTTTPKE